MCNSKKFSPRLCLEIALGTILLFSVFAQAAENQNSIQPDKPPFALTITELFNWTPEKASTDNISRVQLARRFHSPLDTNLRVDTRAKLLYAPDGMNNFANYLQTQPKLNLYNFTHWSQIDLLNWFAGTADKTVQIPSRPWVETAHKNGVKVIGSVFLAVEKWGGNPDTIESLLAQDKDGRFIAADQLIAIATFYGFDGWLINQETDLTAIKDSQNNLVEGKKNPQRGAQLAEKFLQFTKYLTAIAPQGMEIHWYDAMVGDGRVIWQNELNQANQSFIIDKGQASADAIFLNYDWTREMVDSSRKNAERLGISPYDLYFGADLWPTRNAQRAFTKNRWLDDLFFDNGEAAKTSIAIFAPNVNFNFQGNAESPAYSHFEKDPNDYRRFYDTETRLFSGDDLNLARNDKQTAPDAWIGLGQYLPAKSTIQHLPFTTTFNVGQGKYWVSKGRIVSGAWTNMALQDVLPTWQFAILGSLNAKVFFDLDKVYEGGASLAVDVIEAGEGQIPLYQTRLTIQSNTQLQLAYQLTKASVFILLQTDKTTHRFELKPAKSTTDWQLQTINLSPLHNEQLQRISIGVSSKKSLNFHLGKMEIK